MLCCLQHCSFDFAYRPRRIFCRGNNACNNSPSHRCSFSSTTSASMSARGWLVKTCVKTCVGPGSDSSVCHPSMPFMASKAALELWRLNYSSRLHMSLIVNHAIVFLAYFLPFQYSVFSAFYYCCVLFNKNVIPLFRSEKYNLYIMLQ